MADKTGIEKFRFLMNRLTNPASFGVAVIVMLLGGWVFSTAQTNFLAESEKMSQDFRAQYQDLFYNLDDINYIDQIQLSTADPSIQLRYAKIEIQTWKGLTISLGGITLLMVGIWFIPRQYEIWFSLFLRARVLQVIEIINTIREARETKIDQ